MRYRDSARLCALVIGAASVAPGLVSAQVIQGLVVDFESGSPLEGVAIRLLGPDGVVAEVGSSSDGRFRLVAPSGGEWRVTARLLGYADLEPVSVSLTESETLNVEMRLSVEAIPIDEPIVVIAHRPHVNLAIRQYHRRRERGERSGMGHFLYGEELRGNGSMRPTDVLRRVPGIRVDQGGDATRQILRMREGCIPAVYLDGMPLNTVDWRESLDAYVRSHELEGIEVYRGSERPDGYFDRRGCGLILAWTRVEAAEAETGFSWHRLAVGFGLIAGLLLLR